MSIQFYDLGTVNENDLKFAVISAIYKGKWLYVRQKERVSWEIPGGHKETGEIIIETAKRELFEETGCEAVDIVSVCDYSMDDSVNKIFGRLYLAKIKKIGQLPVSEICEVKLFDTLPKNLTYSEIQPKLFKKTLAFMQNNKGYT
ncbi:MULTISPECIES: NUDIX domain-containing protein [unclassified Lysinibacillus]|uniref:NUDIX hydrolase n=1 Tax=unclassified Lysinibacillus TaxID=2636778 RepID=UPI00381EC345